MGLEEKKRARQEEAKARMLLSSCRLSTQELAELDSMFFDPSLARSKVAALREKASVPAMEPRNFERGEAPSAWGQAAMAWRVVQAP